MLRKLFLFALWAPITTAVVLGQEIRITIPLHSELTEVQRLNRLGVDEVVKHQNEKAEVLFYKAYLYDPSDPFTLNNLGYVSEIQGQVDRAADYYKLAVQQGCDAVIDRSSDTRLKGRPMMDALGSIQNMPMRVNRVNTYAIQLLSQDRAFEAEAVLKQVLAVDPENPFVLNNLAVAEEATGNLEDALKYYDAAAATHSTQPIVVALTRSSRGKPIGALSQNAGEELRKRMSTMDIGQIHANMFAVRGVAALNRNDWVAARKAFQDAYAADPNGAFALNNLGYLAERDGDLETAMAYYAKAQRAPDSGDPIGMASQAGARGQHLGAVASDNHRAVDIALNSRNRAPQLTDEPIELIRRDGSPEPPVASPNEPVEPANSPVSSRPPQIP